MKVFLFRIEFINSLSVDIPDIFLPRPKNLALVDPKQIVVGVGGLILNHSISQAHYFYTVFAS